MSHFGTDGIRGRFGLEPITPEFILRLGYVAGRVLVGRNTLGKKPSVIIGKDTRLSGYVIEAALQAGFNAAGVEVYQLGPLPTPAIAHLVRSFHADMGVVISASHNPYFDNGVKFFSHEGKKLSDEFQDAINTALEQGVDCSLDIELGKSYRIEDARGRYIEFCKGSFPYQYDLKGLKIVVDCANGAAYSVAPAVFSELGAQVVAIHNHPDGTNINEQCGSTHPESLQDKVCQESANIGIALDGDGDRIIMVDELGRLVDGDAILYILACHNKPKGVVGTLMSNMALEVALAKQGIAFERAKVGDRYVMQALEAHGWMIGAEPSGHVLCLHKNRTGDAIIAGLAVLQVMVETGKSLSELIQDYTPFPQKIINVRLDVMQDPYENDNLRLVFENAQKQLDGRGRLLIRKSGTEPVIRVMVESDDAIECDVMANEIATKIKAELA